MSDVDVFNVNGLQILFRKKPGRLAHIRIKTIVGSRQEKHPSEYGVAHYLEHMMFKGTKTKDSKQISQLLSKYGDANAYTSYDETHYHINFLSSNTKEAVHLLLDMFFNNSLPDEEFEKERTVILEELQSYEDSPTTTFYSNMYESSLGHKIAHSIVGTKKSLKNLKISSIRKFINTFYNNKNVVLLAVGPSKDEIINAVRSFDFNLNPGDLVCHDKVRVIPGRKEFSHNSKQSCLGLMFNNMNKNESFNSNFVDRIFVHSLGSGMHSILFQRIREELGFCYNINSWKDNIGKDGIIGISTFLNKNNLKKCENEINKIIKEIKEKGIPQEIVDISKNQMKFHLAENELSPSGVVGCLYNYHELGFISPNDIIKKIDKVTNKELIEFANKYLVNPKICIQNVK